MYAIVCIMYGICYAIVEDAGLRNERTIIYYMDLAVIAILGPPS